METEALEKEIGKRLADFYEQRLKALERLYLRKVLSKKNPYLYRALGMEKASEIVEQIMAAFLTSSDETIFGSCFFEPLARFAAGGKVADGEGVDFTVEEENRIMAVAVKSGPSWGNSDQHKRQSSNFDAMRRRLYKMNKRFDPLVGQAYGRQASEATENARFRRLSGQAFWEEITGDPDFYLKIIRLMRDIPQRNRENHLKQWTALVNRFTGEFVRDFCKSNGAVDWEKLVAFTSSRQNA